jgi:hypothetical protein
MTKLAAALIALCFATTQIMAQNENATLIVQSPHGKVVKMIWLFKSWNPEWKGFNIKRKEGIKQEWKKINKEPIYPEISLKKNIANVEQDVLELERLKTYLASALTRKELKECLMDSFYVKLQNDTFLNNFSKEIAENYDEALLSGFGFVDRTLEKKIDYEYALFESSTDQFLARASWSYGEVPDLNLINEITSKSTRNKRGIRIFWNADVNKMKAGYVHGFNVYRDGIRLNLDPIAVSYNNDLSEFSWYDSTANSEEVTQYSIASESMLDIEGIIKAYTYNPEEHPDAYAKTEVTSIASLGYYFKDGIKVQWKFPQNAESLIKGFIVEKNNVPNGYKKVSTLLQPSAREFIDKTTSPVFSYEIFKVVAIYKDRSEISGVEKLYNYFPLREPPQPQNCTAVTKFDGKAFTISLSWDGRINGDTVTKAYNIYLFDPITHRMVLDKSVSPVKTNSCVFVLNSGTYRTNKYCVAAITKNGTESILGDTIFVTVPTLVMPVPEKPNITINKHAINLKWEYPNLEDLKGFRIYQNKYILKNETFITKDMREFNTEDLAVDNTYEYSIQAVSEKGVVSKISGTRYVNIPADPEFK